MDPRCTIRRLVVDKDCSCSLIVPQMANQIMQVMICWPGKARITGLADTKAKMCVHDRKWRLNREGLTLNYGVAIVLRGLQMLPVSLKGALAVWVVGDHTNSFF